MACPLLCNIFATATVSTSSAAEEEDSASGDDEVRKGRTYKKQRSVLRGR